MTGGIGMTENNSYNAMAKQFLDMWQSQSTNMMADSDFVQSMLAMMQSNVWADGGDDAGDKRNRETATAAPDANDGELAMLKRRIERLEARISELESK